MSARALAAWSGAVLGGVLVTNNPAVRGLLLLIAANVVARLAPGRLRGLGRGLLVAAAFAVALNLLLSHSGVHVLAALPVWLPLVGGPLTLEALAYGVAVAAGLAASVLAVTPLVVAADPTDVVEALPARLDRSGAAIAAALGFLPAVGRSFAEVSEAQRMRGWRPRGPRSWAEVVVPVMLTAVEGSIQLAEAMEARGYGSGARTRFPRRRGGGRDRAVALAALAGLAGLAVCRATGLLSDWYPFPALSVPPVTPAAVASCLPFSLPLLLWRSPPSAG